MTFPTQTGSDGFFHIVRIITSSNMQKFLFHLLLSRIPYPTAICRTLMVIWSLQVKSSESNIDKLTNQFRRIVSLMMSAWYYLTLEGWWHHHVRIVEFYRPIEPKVGFLVWTSHLQVFHLLLHLRVSSLLLHFADSWPAIALWNFCNELVVVIAKIESNSTSKPAMDKMKIIVRTWESLVSCRRVIEINKRSKCKLVLEFCCQTL